MHDKNIQGVVELEKIHIDDYNNGIFNSYEHIGPETNDISWPNLLVTTISTTTTPYMAVTTPASGTLNSYWTIRFAVTDFIQSPINIGIPCYDGTTNTSVNTNAGYPVFVPKTLPIEKDYVTYVADLLPATQTRTIYGVGIGTTGSVFGGYGDTTVTNLRLSSPCVQNTSTVIRVTYKLYLDDESTSTSKVSDGYFAYLRNIFKLSSNGTYNSSYALDTYPSYYYSSFYDLTNMTLSRPVGFNNFTNCVSARLSDMGLANISATNMETYQNSLAFYNKNHPITDNYSMGAFVRCLNLAGNGYNSSNLSANYATVNQIDSIYMSQRIVPAGTSPIQNVFKQTSSATGPLQDLNALGTMKGTLNIDSSSWSTQKYPKVFKVNIISSGDATTATYKVESLTFTGGFVQNSYCPRDAIIPQDGLNVLSTGYYKNNFKDAYVLDFVNLGGTTIRSPDNNKYIVTASCLRTKTGIAYYNMETGMKVVLNATSTPALPVANVSDIAVSNGYTFVTCSTTGLWQIDSTFSTVTHLTSIGAGVDSSKAYQIDVKSNGDLWVLFEGGLCKGTTSNSGATWSWSVYNTGSGFTASGITNSNWSNVTSMCVDPDHANDRILFILGSASATNTYAAGFIWWERSTSTTTVMTTGIAYPSFSLNNNLKRSDLVRCINGYWFTNIETSVDTSSTYHMCTWSGATPPASWTSRATGTPIYSSARFIPATIAGVSGALVGSSASYKYGDRSTFPSTVTQDSNATPAFFINSANFSSLPATLNTQSLIEFYVKYGAVDTITATLESYNIATYFNGANPVCYMSTSNMAVYWNDSVGKFSVSPIIPKPTITNYATYKPAAWKSYGWDGSAWVLGNSSARTCHTSAQPFFDGLSISFTNGTSTPHFVAGESFVFVVGDGMMKDNATDYTFTYNVYQHDSELVSSFYDFANGVSTIVPNKAVGALVDEYVNFSPTTNGTDINASSSSRLQCNPQLRGMITGSKYYSHISDNGIPAATPFTLKFKLSGLPLSADRQSMQIMWYDGASFFTGNFKILSGTNGAINTLRFYYAFTMLCTYTPTDIETEYTLSRASNGSINFYIGGVLYGSTNMVNTQFNNPICINPELSTYNDGLMGYRDMKLSYYEPRRLLRIGNPTTFTGYFNPKFGGTTISTLPADEKIYVNGVQQTIAHKHPFSAVSPLNVKILPGSALLEFPTMPIVTVSENSPSSYYSPAAVFPIMSTSKSVNKTVTITNAGAGYTDGTYPMTFSSGSATGTITISGGVVTLATVTNGGSGYTTAPTIGIGGSPGSPSTPATFQSYIGYNVASLNVQNFGFGLGNSQTITISAPTGTGGHAAVATITMDTTKSVNKFVTMTNNGGAGYTDGTYPLVFSGGGGGAGAAGNVIIKNGAVVFVDITNQGSGYTSAPSATFSGAGSPTTVCTLSCAINYKVSSVAITDVGSGYIPDADQTVSGYATAHYHF